MLGYRSWYILLFGAPWLPELLFSANDYETINTMFRKAPSGTKRPAAITADEVERQGSMPVDSTW